MFTNVKITILFIIYYYIYNMCYIFFNVLYQNILTLFDILNTVK